MAGDRPAWRIGATSFFHSCEVRFRENQQRDLIHEFAED